MAITRNTSLSNVADLIFYLDAVNPKSYPGSGATWNDLSPNRNNFTLFNTPTYTSNGTTGTYLTFNGTNQYARSVNAINFNAYSAVTIEIGYRTTVTTAAQILYETTGTGVSTATGGITLLMNSNNISTVTNTYLSIWQGYGPRLFGFTPSTNTSFNSVVETFVNGVNSTGRQVYINGTTAQFFTNTSMTVLTSATTAGLAFANTWTYVASRAGTSNFFRGDIAYVRAWGRKLATSDLGNNVSAIAARQLNSYQTPTIITVDPYVPPAPTIITTGLQLWLDAGNASSYSGSGTAWNDLSGNGNNGTLVSSPTYYPSTIDQVPCIGFNGTNQRVSFTYQTPTQTASTGFTWTILYYALNGADSYIMMGYRGTTPLKFYKLTTQKFEMYPAEVYGPVLRNGWRVVTAVYDGTLGNPGNMKVYHGSEYSSTYGGTLNNIAPSFPIELRDADTPDLLASTMPFYVGGDPIGGEYYNGYISTVIVYNRALTAGEIDANYQVLKQKYPYGFALTYTKTASITESPSKTFTTTSGLTWGTDQIYSTTGYTNTAFTSCYYRGASGSQAMFALNTDPTTDPSYTSLDYAWFFAGFGSAGIWENNVQVVSPSIVYAEYDKFSIEYDGTNVVYKKNGTAVRTVARSVGSALYLDSAFNSTSGANKFVDLRFGGT